MAFTFYTICRWSGAALSHPVMSDSVAPWTAARQAPLFLEFPRQEYWSGWPFPTPGNLALAGGFFTMWKWKPLSHVQFFATPRTVHGILQARILEWVAFPSCGGSSQPRDRSQVSRIAGGFFTTEMTIWCQPFLQQRMLGLAAFSAHVISDLWIAKPLWISFSKHILFSIISYNLFIKFLPSSYLHALHPHPHAHPVKEIII